MTLFNRFEHNSNLKQLFYITNLLHFGPRIRQLYYWIGHTFEFTCVSRQCIVPRDPKGCSSLLQVRTRRGTTRKGATIIEVYTETAVAGALPPSGPTTPKRGGV